MKDMFGIDLEVGQHVLYADDGDDDAPILCVYTVVELTPDVCVAELLNGGTGNWFYLEDTWKRCAVVGTANELYTLASYYGDSVLN